MIDELKALRIEVASLRAENGRLETATRAYIEGHELALTRAETAESERDALRAEVKRLREALSRITEHPYANGRQLCEMARAALAAPEAGEEGSGDAHAWNAGSWFDG